LNCYEIIAWDQNTKVVPKNEPNFYIFLEDFFIPFKSFFFTGSLDNFICRKHCIDLYFSLFKYTCIFYDWFLRFCDLW